MSSITTSPLIARLWLGDGLRALRDTRTLSGTEAGRLLGTDRVGISRMEQGKRRTRTSVVMSYLEALGLSERDDEYKRLVRLARAAEVRGWWEAATYAGMGPRQIRTADIENGAAVVRQYQPTMLPGLVQTEAYARGRSEALLAEDAEFGLDEEFDLEVTLAGRARRQEEIFGRDEPKVEYEVIVEELAIRRLVVEPEVMRGQLCHLLDLVTKAAITLRVVPV